MLIFVNFLTNELYKLPLIIFQTIYDNPHYFYRSKLYLI